MAGQGTGYGFVSHQRRGAAKCCGTQSHLQCQRDVHGSVFKCWIGELFLGKVFQTVDATVEQGTGWLVLQPGESSPVFSSSQAQLNAPDGTP